jgi:tRNA dimethylallyltransferase
MDIGTAKPTPDDQSKITHHLLDVVTPDREFSLAEYLTLAHETVKDIHSRGKQVLFVGGTPLYLKSMLRGVCEGPPADEGFRQEVENEIAEVGIDALRNRLQQIDPLSAAKLHPNDKRRMIRALEVYKLTGQPISHYQLQFEQAATSPCRHAFVLSRERSALHDRINQRVDAMFEAGLIEEVTSLRTKYGQFSKTALQGVGYREVLQHLDGEMNLDEAIEQTKIRTRRFARRQETWFRGLEECQWISVNDETRDEELLERFVDSPNQSGA